MLLSQSLKLLIEKNSHPFVTTSNNSTSNAVNSSSWVSWNESHARCPPSLAAWPVVYGLVFITRSLGFAYNEVVVALLDKPNGKISLLKFTRILAVTTVSILAVLALSPLGYYWFSVSGLSKQLSQLSSTTLLLQY